MLKKVFIQLTSFGIDTSLDLALFNEKPVRKQIYEKNLSLNLIELFLIEL